MRGRDLALGMTPFLLILLGWYLAYQFSLIPHWILDSPIQVANVLREMLTSGKLLHLIGVSASHATIGFLLAIGVGIPLGFFIGHSELLHALLYPLITALYPIPTIAWLPLVVILVGFTVKSIYIVVFLAAFFNIIYNTIAGVSGVRKELLWASESMGVSGFEMFRRVILPASLPHILTGLRLGWGHAWRALVAAEMLATVAGLRGLGSFIWEAQFFIRFDKVIVGIIVLAAVGLLVEHLFFGQFESRTLRKWGMIRG